MKKQNNQRLQTILLATLAAIFCLNAIGCNQAPSDMFPKSVGAFQFNESSKPWTDEKGRSNFDGKYVSPDNKTISCHAFDSASEEDAVVSVAERRFSDDTRPLIPILDKSGKQIGVKYLSGTPGNGSYLSWNIRKRTYWCNTDVAEKTLEEFDKNWQNQTSKQ